MKDSSLTIYTLLLILVTYQVSCWSFTSKTSKNDNDLTKTVTGNRILELVPSQNTEQAVANIRGKVNGKIFFRQTNNGYVVIQGKITGLTPGEHGFHIHQYGDISNNCKAAGGHYNPLQYNHAAPINKKRHVGDLGNIIADSNGVASINIFDSIVNVNMVIGRSVVIHAKKDDLGIGGDEGSRKTGNAGSRIGCGVIGRSI